MAAVATPFIERYKYVLGELAEKPLVESVRDPESIGSGWGIVDRPYRESIGQTFAVHPGEDVLICSRARLVNINYAVASSVWILLGRNDLAALEPFNPRGANFSVDGFTLSGAFGHRLRVLDGDQIVHIVDLIRRDPSTRRAICFIGRPDDLAQMSRDFPCASSMQFFLRDSLLQAVVHMRSQSFFGVFPYDVVNFRYVQLYVARQLGVAVGFLHMLFGSLHIYQEEDRRIMEFLSEPDTATAPLPELPWSDLSALLESWLDPLHGKERISEFLRRAGS